MVDGKIRLVKNMASIPTVENAVAYLGLQDYWVSRSEFRRFSLKIGKVEYPGRSFCDENPAGMFAANKWNKPMPGVTPCQGKYFALENRYVIKFDLKIMKKSGQWRELFRITETPDKNYSV